MVEFNVHTVAMDAIAQCAAIQLSEEEAVLNLDKFARQCDVLRSHLTPFAKSIAHALTVALKGARSAGVEALFHAAEHMTIAVGAAIGDSLAFPFLNYLTTHPKWTPRMIEAATTMLLCAGDMVPLPVRLQIECHALSTILASEPAEHLAELLHLVTTSVLHHPTQLQSPYLLHCVLACRQNLASPSPQVREASQAGLAVLSNVAHPAHTPLAQGCRADSLEDILKTLSEPQVA
eukprot:NODE_4183_length_829_cov_73.780627_g4025_i0.p1 GENE.NODE_4183_length_829_cov_73.780627_g4025_i0~~NODE_4183_length_829_cov_73.780627_g4025_i0.p1  ORF type:complete len:248 (+),score=80.83 NODE_4183_length_829_cov_73.780627_g4025_i0:44-745(+)